MRSATLVAAACGAAVAIALLARQLGRRRSPATLPSALCLDPRYQHGSLSVDLIKAKLPANVSVADLELHPPYDKATAKRIYDKYGCVIARGLTRAYVEEIRNHADGAFQQAVRLLEAGAFAEVVNDGCFVGWVTPDQTLFIPAPTGHCRDKQVMVLGLDYFISAAMFHAATDSTTLDLIEAITDSPAGIELFGKGQCFYKEGVSKASDAGGLQQKHLHPSATMASVQATEHSGKPGGRQPQILAPGLGVFYVRARRLRRHTQLHNRDQFATRQRAAICCPWFPSIWAFRACGHAVAPGTSRRLVFR